MKVTPMKELLSWIRKELPMDLDYPRMIEAKILEMQKQERSVIENAYNDAKNFPSTDCDGNKYYFMNFITND